MLIFLLSLIITAAAIQYWTIEHVLDGVSHSYEPSLNLKEPDEPLELITNIRNTSLRFIPFIEVAEILPIDVTILKDVKKEESILQDYLVLKSTTYLLPRQSWSRKIPITISKRGRYILRGASLRGGDFLGIRETTVRFPQMQEIVVIPSPWQENALIETLGGFLGDISVNRFILEDPVLTLGYREYTGQEPQKMISWNQSARSGQLMVKRYDYTLELTITIILNVEHSKSLEAKEVLEACFSMVRTLCEELEKKHVKYSFVTNGSAAGAMSLWNHIGEGLGTAHLYSILEGLGRATYDCRESFDITLSRIIKYAEQGRSYIIVTPELTMDYTRPVEQLRYLTGSKVMVLTPKEAIIK